MADLENDDRRGAAEILVALGEVPTLVTGVIKGDHLDYYIER
jgi:hypothetical protein